MRVFGYSSLADYIERCPSDAAVAATLEEFWKREFEGARKIEETAAARKEEVARWERENPEALRRFNETWDRLIEEGRQRYLRPEEEPWEPWIPRLWRLLKTRLGSGY